MTIAEAFGDSLKTAMIQDLKIIHRKKPRQFAEQAGLHVWSTCLRSLAFGQVTLMHAEDEVYTRQEAYAFLLETICGMKSPIVGETEVFGQFKAFSQEWVKAEPMRAGLVQKILSDAKAIRNDHLSHLGIQSYGSWIRKNLKTKKVHILGAGILVREILPYLLKRDIEVVLHVRDPRKVDFFEGSIRKLGDDTGFGDGALIVAAPLTSEQIEMYLSGAKPEQIIDLRETSESDSITSPSNISGLHEIFAQIARTRIELEPRLLEVRREIAERSLRLADHSVLRPQGWDDLCA